MRLWIVLATVLLVTASGSATAEPTGDDGSTAPERVCWPVNHPEPCILTCAPLIVYLVGYSLHDDCLPP